MSLPPSMPVPSFAFLHPPHTFEKVPPVVEEVTPNHQVTASMFRKRVSKQRKRKKLANKSKARNR